MILRLNCLADHHDMYFFYLLKMMYEIRYKVITNVDSDTDTGVISY